MLTCATMLWSPNRHTMPASRCYDETWVEKLAAGFRRNLTLPHRFVVFTDRRCRFSAGIEQQPIGIDVPDYGAFTVPYQLDVPMILAGLDTVIVGNLDRFGAHCLTANRITLPRDPYQPDRSINGVALVPAGQRRIFDDWRGENDMDWLRQQDTAFIDDIWPGEVVSLKAADVRRRGLQAARIVYFHGRPKPHELPGLDWIREHWRA